MKNLSILLLSFCVLFFSGCKKEEELSTKEKIVGTWTHKESIVNVYDENDQLISNSSRESSGITEYKSDGTFEYTDNSVPSQVLGYTGTWYLIDDSVVQIEYKRPPITGVETDSVDVNVEFNIEKITEKRFVFFRESEAKRDGTDENVRIKSTSILVK